MYVRSDEILRNKVLKNIIGSLKSKPLPIVYFHLSLNINIFRSTDVL